LAKKYLNYTTKSYKDVVKKLKDFSEVDIKDALFYASEDAVITYILY
jgi:DNA polymerase-1